MNVPAAGLRRPEGGGRGRITPTAVGYGFDLPPGVPVLAVRARTPWVILGEDRAPAIPLSTFVPMPWSPVGLQAPGVWARQPESGRCGGLGPSTFAGAGSARSSAYLLGRLAPALRGREAAGGVSPRWVEDSCRAGAKWLHPRGFALTNSARYYWRGRGRSAQAVSGLPRLGPGPAGLASCSAASTLPLAWTRSDSLPASAHFRIGLRDTPRKAEFLEADPEAARWPGPRPAGLPGKPARVESPA